MSTFTPHARKEKVPAELLALPQWVAWKWVVVDGAKKKLPLNTHAKNQADLYDLADTTNPATWGTFEEASKRYFAAKLHDPHGAYLGVRYLRAWKERHAAGIRLAGGLGFVVTADDPFLGIDIDACIPSLGPNVIGNSPPSAEARRLIDTFASYTEKTPSDTGVRIWVRARLGDHQSRRKNSERKIELYDRERFFTVTGHAFPTYPVIEDRQAEVDALYEELFGHDAPPVASHSLQSTAPTNGTGNGTGHRGGNGQAPDDAAVLAAIRTSKSGAKLDALMRGDTGAYPSPSEADAALIALLCNYTDDDAQVARLFGASGLADRAKAARPDYIARSIANWRKKQGWRADWNSRPVADTINKTNTMVEVVNATNESNNFSPSPPEPSGDTSPDCAAVRAENERLRARLAELEAQLARRDRQLAAQRSALLHVTDERNALWDAAHHPRTSRAVGAVWALAKRLRRHPTIITHLPMQEMAAEGATSGATMTRLVTDLEKTALVVQRTDHPARDGRPKRSEVAGRLAQAPPTGARFQDALGYPTTAATVHTLLRCLPATPKVSDDGNTFGGARRKAWCITCKRDTDHLVERRRIERCADCQTIIDDTLTTIKVTPAGTSSTIYYGAPHGLTPQWSAGFQDETRTPDVPAAGFQNETSLNTDPGFQDETRTQTPPIVEEDTPLWRVPTGRVRTPDGLGYATGYYDGHVQVALDAAPDTVFPYARWDVAPLGDIPATYGTAADD